MVRRRGSLTFYNQSNLTPGNGNKIMTTERMSNEFTKYHLNRYGRQPWPFRPVIHHFTGPDVDGPHDHPWSFTSFILSGSYIEEVYILSEDRQTWTREVIERRAGSSHKVEATHIHRIIELPEGECWTMVIAGPKERVPHFWKFSEGGIFVRPWNRRDFKPLK